MTNDKKPEFGTCCYCNAGPDSGNEETPCPPSPDEAHCYHWWELEEEDNNEKD